VARAKNTRNATALIAKGRREVARIVLHIDPERDPDCAQRASRAHLARTKWMSPHDYQHPLLGGTFA
jgi:hypothetical protein